MGENLAEMETALTVNAKNGRWHFLVCSFSLTIVGLLLHQRQRVVNHQTCWMFTIRAQGGSESKRSSKTILRRLQTWGVFGKNSHLRPSQGSDPPPRPHPQPHPQLAWEQPEPHLELVCRVRELNNEASRRRGGNSNTSDDLFFLNKNTLTWH